MDGSEIDAIVDDLEASYEWRAGAAETVRGLLAQVPEGPDAWLLRARPTLLGVDELVRDHGAPDAALIALTLRDRAADGGHRGLQARAERALSILFREIGDPARGLEHAVAALALDGDDLDPTMRCRLLLGVADTLTLCGSFEDARTRYQETFDQARCLSAPWLSLVVLNNWAYAELLDGRLEAAWGLAEQLQAVAAEHHASLMPVNAGTVAEVLHARGSSAEAIDLLRHHLRHAAQGFLFDVAGCWLTLAQIELESGDLDAAGTSLDTAEHLTTTHALHGLRVEALGSHAELLAARGDHAGAYETHLRFHAETLALSSTAADARARTLHAMHEADLARRESARYRELSHRDPLTGLHNRRHVDEDLDRRLTSRPTTTLAPLTIAMVDIDRFKRVNDTFSHEAGDAVLVRLARLLDDAATTAAASPEAYAARLGGEEFLLVLPGVDLDHAYAIAEDLRRRVAATDWSDIAPGLPVTASTGLAATPDAARPPPDRPDLLRRADRHLYAAKASGRNRVEPTPARSASEVPLPLALAAQD